MSLPLENEIMEAIGLGMHFNWYNGSRSCGGIRARAIDQLRDAIQRSHDKGEQIIEPNMRAIGVCWQADRLDQQEGGEETLTKTWQACANVIRWHMDQWHKRQALRKPADI